MEQLLERIMRRLGLERQLQVVRQHLGLFISLFAACVILSAVAFVGFMHMLAESSIGALMSLIPSDPGMVVRYGHTFMLSVAGSLPEFSLALFLGAVAAVLLLARIVSSWVQTYIRLHDHR